MSIFAHVHTLSSHHHPPVLPNTFGPPIPHPHQLSLGFFSTTPHLLSTLSTVHHIHNSYVDCRTHDWVIAIPWAAIAHPSIPGTPYRCPPGFHLTAINFMWLTLPVSPVCPAVAWGDLCPCTCLCASYPWGPTAHSPSIFISILLTLLLGAHATHTACPPHFTLSCQSLLAKLVHPWLGSHYKPIYVAYWVTPRPS